MLRYSHRRAESVSACQLLDAAQLTPHLFCTCTLTTDALGQAGAPVGAAVVRVAMTVVYAVIAHLIPVAFAEPGAGHPSATRVLTAVTLPIVMTSTARAVEFGLVLTQLVTGRTAVGTTGMAVVTATVGRPALAGLS